MDHLGTNNLKRPQQPPPTPGRTNSPLAPCHPTIPVRLLHTSFTSCCPCPTAGSAWKTGTCGKAEGGGEEGKGEEGDSARHQAGATHAQQCSLLRQQRAGKRWAQESAYENKPGSSQDVCTSHKGLCAQV